MKKRATAWKVGFLLAVVGVAVFLKNASEPAAEAAAAPSQRAMTLGVNLFGPATYNRQQVFMNLIAQSEWFASRGSGWSAFPADQLDERGWIKELKSGQTAPRPLIMPPAPYRPIVVRCRFDGKGQIEAGGVATIRERGAQSLLLDLSPTGKENEAAWIELTRTDSADPIRAIDCRDVAQPADQRFHPDFLNMVRQFAFIRFLDWQRINDNAAVTWSGRTQPDSSSQVGPAGVSAEDMIDLANSTATDPWFLMPYRADAAYIRAFAQLVRQRLDADRTVYIELGNEVWNDQFEAARQAQREGLTLKLGDGDPGRAQMTRYAQKLRTVMQIWTREFAGRPDRLVRVAAGQNANPALAEIVLSHQDTAQWVDALATAPYIWIDLDGYGPGDRDRVFARMPGAIADAFTFAERNKAVALRYGKRFITYEGGQHLVTKDLVLARGVQRDRRMRTAYETYLARWQAQMGDALALYATTTPISEHGSWGLLEYGGQPLADAPKMQAVQAFLKKHP